MQASGPPTMLTSPPTMPQTYGYNGNSSAPSPYAAYSVNNGKMMHAVPMPTVPPTAPNLDLRPASPMPTAPPTKLNLEQSNLVASPPAMSQKHGYDSTDGAPSPYASNSNGQTMKMSPYLMPSLSRSSSMQVMATAPSAVVLESPPSVLQNPPPRLLTSPPTMPQTQGYNSMSDTRIQQYVDNYVEGQTVSRSSSPVPFLARNSSLPTMLESRRTVMQNPEPLKMTTNPPTHNIGTSIYDSMHTKDIGIISCRIIACYHLPEVPPSRGEASSYGSYVRLSYDGKVARTKCLPGTDPRFHSQTFDFNVSREHKEDLLLEVLQGPFEFSGFSNDNNATFLGKMVVSVDKVMRAAEGSHVLPIRAKLVERQGKGQTINSELQVEVSFKQGTGAYKPLIAPTSYLDQYWPEHKPSFQNVYQEGRRPLPAQIDRDMVPTPKYDSQACHLGQYDYSITPMYTPSYDGVNKKNWQEDPFYGWRHSRKDHKTHQHVQHTIMMVRILRGYSLKHVTGDSFVQVSIPRTGQLFKTNTAEKGENPKWNSKPFKFKLVRPDHALKLLLEVITTRGHVGKLDISLDELSKAVRRQSRQGEGVRFRRQLHGEKKSQPSKDPTTHERGQSPAGRRRSLLEQAADWVTPSMNPKAVTTGHNQKQRHESDKRTIGTLSVKILGASNLINCDTGIGIGNWKDLSDPYCTVTVGGSSQRTETINNDLNPRWKKNTFQFPIETGSEMIDCVLMNENSAMNDDFLGRAEFLMEDVLKRKDGTALKKKVQLWDVEHGELSVELSYASHRVQPAAGDDRITSSSANHNKLGFLMVKVLGAYNLINTDTGVRVGDWRDVSDPYCKVTVDRSSQRTETINNNLNPRWQNDTFQFPIKTGSEIIEFAVMDEDTVGNDDFLGRTEFLMEDVLKRQEGTALKRRVKLSGVAHGELEVELRRTQHPLIPGDEQAGEIEFEISIEDEISSAEPEHHEHASWRDEWVTREKNQEGSRPGTDAFSGWLPERPSSLMEPQAKENPFWEWHNHESDVSLIEGTPRTPKSSILRLPSFSDDKKTRFEGKHEYNVPHRKMDGSTPIKFSKVRHWTDDSWLRNFEDADKQRDRVWKANPFYGWIPEAAGQSEDRDWHEHMQPLYRARIARLPSFSDPKGHWEEKAGIGVLKVRIIGAYGLMKDRWDNQPNSYCEISMHETQHRSIVKHGTIDPVWDTDIFTFLVHSLSDDLELEIRQENSNNEPSRICPYFTYPVRTIASRDGQWIRICEKLHPQGQHCGKVDIEIMYLSFDMEREHIHESRQDNSIGTHHSPSPSSKRKPIQELESRQDEEIGTLSVKILAAYNLINRDTGIGVGNLQDVSDPYCTVTVAGRSKRTETVNNNLNPRWKKNEFQFSIKTGQEIIEFVVMDEDSSLQGSDDFLGRMEVQMEGVMRKEGSVIPLRDQLWDVPNGELEVELSFRSFSETGMGAPRSEKRHSSF